MECQQTLSQSGMSTNILILKGALYRILCDVNRLGDSGVNRLGDTSAFVIPAGQQIVNPAGKTRMYTVGIVFEF